MRTWRLTLLSLLLCTTWLGCSDDPEPTPDGGVRVDSGTPPADAGSDAGTDPADSGSDAGTDPTDAGSDAGTDPMDAGTDGGTSGGDAGTDAGTEDNAVRVTNFMRYVTASGVEEQPEVVNPGALALLVLDGDEFVSIAPTTEAPGRYSFPDVPRGTHYLKLGFTYIVTSARNVDLDTEVLGRPEVVLLDQELMADFALSGLEPVSRPPPPFPPVLEDPEPELRVFSEQVGYAGAVELGDTSGGTTFSADDVEVRGLTSMGVEFEADKGDRPWVVQLNRRSMGFLPDGGTQHYLAVVRGTQLPPVSYDGGQPMRLAGTLQPLTTNELPLDWRVSEFAAHAAEVNPTATLSSSRLTVEPIPFGPEGVWSGYSNELVRLDRPRRDSADAVGTLFYGNPFPSNWGTVARASVSFRVSLEVPNERTIVLSAPAIVVSDRPAALSAGPIVPRVRPPLNLTLDGTQAYTARTIEAGAHVIAWQPPAIGTPNAYVVSLRRYDSGPFVPAGNIYLSGSATSVRLPPGLLQPGQHYYFTVRAVRADGYDVSSKPFDLGDQVVVSSGIAVSGVVSVAAQTP